MKKEELVHLQMLLAQLKMYCEENDLDCDFSEYDTFGIPPVPGAPEQGRSQTGNIRPCSQTCLASVKVTSIRE
jgi:hypothetical protein